MAKATLKLPDGTNVTVDGSPEQIHRVLSLYAGNTSRETTRLSRKSAKKTKTAPAQRRDRTGANLNDIVNLVKSCDEAEAIERTILDRASQVDRILLPLYVVHEYQDNQFGLTSGDIAKITTELGVRVTQPHASTGLSTTASRYVMGDKVRKKGQPVRYRLSRRGLQYMKSVISDRSNGD